MRPRRLSLQWQMIGIVVLAVLIWGGREAGPDVVRRYRNCEAQQRQYALAASRLNGQAMQWSLRGQAAVAQSLRQDAARASALSRQYGRARWNPWVFLRTCYP